MPGSCSSAIPAQLASIEAGAVLGDIVGPGDDRDPRCRRTGPGSSCSTASTASAAGSPGWRRRSARGDAEATMALLREGAGRRDRGSRPTPRAPRPRRWFAPARWRPREAVIAAARDGDPAPSAGGAGHVPDPVRPPPRAVRRDHLDDADGGLAGGRGRRLLGPGALVRRPSAAGHRERLRAGAEQRRRRRRGPGGRGPGDGQLRARRRAGRLQPQPASARSRPCTR